MIAFVQRAAARLGLYLPSGKDDAREAEVLFRQIRDAAFEGVIIHDNGYLLAANPAFERMFGYTQEELKGENFLDLLPTDASRQAILDHIGERSEERYEIAARRKDGSLIIAEITGRSTTFRGRPARVATVLDITSRRLSEAELENRSVQLLEADRAKKAREQMLSVVAHDLRNPLHTIMMASELLSENLPGDSSARRQMEMLQRACQTMRVLLNDLLDLKRIDSRQLYLDRRPLAIGKWLTDTAEMFRPMVRAADLTLDVEIANDLPEISADANRVQQVLSNLVANAIKFTAARGRVTIGASREADVVRVSVADTGSGISADQLPYVFGEFWQANKTDARGLGLGLAIAKGIVESHGGTISVDSTVGSGTTFAFTLPGTL